MREFIYRVFGFDSCSDQDACAVYASAWDCGGRWREIHYSVVRLISFLRAFLKSVMFSSVYERFLLLLG